MRKIINKNYQRAKDILTEKMDTLHLMAEALIKYETIDANQISEIMSGKPPSPPADWGQVQTLDKQVSETKPNKTTINGQALDQLSNNS